MAPALVETIGYLASALVVFSLIMSSVLRLRVIGLVGAVVFTTYGLLIGSIPVVVTNLCIVVVHGFHLARILRDRASDSYFEVVRWPVFGTYLPRFLEFHRDDIIRSQPSFAGLRDEHEGWVVLRDAEPVGLVLATHDGRGNAHIELDYVRPEHRDLRAGEVFYDRDDALGREGIHTVTADAETDLHRRYLEQMGFTPAEGSTTRMRRAVGPRVTPSASS
ncbi:MAG: YgjV family protein [Nitriliruptoraceae bacterium]|nr:YgjV family protein [Nitriliruptoraceae bacterium]